MQGAPGKKLDLVSKPSTLARRKVVGQHRAQEQYATGRARLLVTVLKLYNRRDAALDDRYLATMAKKWKVTEDHVELFKNVVRATVNKP